MMDESESGTMAVNMPSSSLHRVKEQLSAAIKLRNIKGVSLFMGLGEANPFNLPAKDVVANRMRKNIIFFATNYALVALMVGAVAIMMNPFFLFVLMCLGILWFYVGISNTPGTVEEPTLVFGKNVTSDQKRFGMIILSATVIIVFGGSVLFTIVGASTGLSFAHATLRDCAVVQENEELGFLNGDATISEQV